MGLSCKVDIGQPAAFRYLRMVKLNLAMSLNARNSRPSHSKFHSPYVLNGLGWVGSGREWKGRVGSGMEGPGRVGSAVAWETASAPSAEDLHDKSSKAINDPHPSFPQSHLLNERILTSP